MKKSIKKKVICLFLSIFLVLCFTSCGKQKQPSNSDSVQESSDYGSEESTSIPPSAASYYALDESLSAQEVRERLLGEWYCAKSYEPTLIFYEDGTVYRSDGDWETTDTYQIESYSNTMYLKYEDREYRLQYHGDPNSLDNYYFADDELYFWKQCYYREMPKGELFQKLIGTWKEEIHGTNEMTFRNDAITENKSFDENGALLATREQRFCIDEKALIFSLNGAYYYWNPSPSPDSSVRTWALVDSGDSTILILNGKTYIKQ